MRHNNKYKNDSFTRSNAFFYKSYSKINEVLYCKNHIKECGNFSRSTYFQVATESYLIRAAKLAPVNPSSKCTFEKKLSKKSKKKQELITSVKKCKRTNKCGIILFFCYETFTFQKMTNDCNLSAVVTQKIS